jgi:hypothetical protein
MKKRWAVLVASAGILVAGCDSAGDRASGTHHGKPEPAAVTSTPRPTASPWPGFGGSAYSYNLRTTCICPGAGVPVVVMVRDGKAISAVFAHRGRGHAAGDDAGDWQQITIDDVIEAANNEDAYLVRVRWPEGQDYPRSVFIDLDANGADDEIGYSIRDVTPI